MIQFLIKPQHYVVILKQRKQLNTNGNKKVIIYFCKGLVAIAGRNIENKRFKWLHFTLFVLVLSVSNPIQTD